MKNDDPAGAAHLVGDPGTKNDAQPNGHGDAPLPTHEVPSEDTKRLVAAINGIREDLHKGRISNNEFEERMTRALSGMEAARAKNVPVVPATPSVTLGGWLPGIPLSWNRAMSLRTHDSQLLQLQELQNEVVRRAVVLAIRKGDLIPGREYSLADVGRYIPAGTFQEVEDYRELAHVRKLAAGSFIDTATATSGAEWVPTGFARVGVDFPFVDSDFIPQLEQVNIPMGVGPFSVPIETARSQAQRVGQQNGVQSAYIRTTGIKTPLTDTWDFAPQVIEHGYQWSMEANDDLAVDMLQRAIRQTRAGIARGVRQVAINAQTASDTTLDDAPAVSGIETADGFSAAFGGRGYRLHCIENAYTDSLGGARATYLDTITCREKMGKFGANPMELFYVTGPKGYVGMLADKDVRTADVFGPTAATIVRGSLAAVGGVPIFPDSEFPDTLDSGGINAGTGTLSGGIMVNRTRWAFANKRSVETVIIPGVGMGVMTVLSRARFDHAVAVPGSVGGGAGSGEHSAHYLINIK